MSDANEADLTRTMPGTEEFAANDPCGEPSSAYRYLFQGWVLLFLSVVCFALINYLLTFIPTGTTTS